MRLSVQSGYTLSSLLVGLFLSTLISTVAIEHYLSLKRDYQYTIKQLNQNLSRSLSLQILRHSLYHAGFTPCGSYTKLSEISENMSAARPPIEILRAPEQGLQITRMSNAYFPIQLDGSRGIISPAGFRFHPGDTLLVSNCRYFQRIPIKDVSKRQSYVVLKLQLPVNPLLQTGSFVGLWLEERFYIKAKGLYYQHGSPELISRQWKALYSSAGSGKNRGMRLRLINERGVSTVIDTVTPNV